MQSRVFFLNRAHARAAGYRPCAVCLPREFELNAEELGKILGETYEQAAKISREFGLQL